MLCPEGASCTTALDLMGLCAVGRQNNADGDAPTLAYLQRTRTPDRPVIILAENDANGAGRTGGERAAARTANLSGRDVGLAFPPNGHKDYRDWFIARVAEIRAAGGTVDEQALGDELLDHIEATAVWIKPGQNLAPVPCAGGDGASATSHPDPIIDARNREELAAASLRNQQEREPCPANPHALPAMPDCHTKVAIADRARAFMAVVCVSCLRWACPHCACILKRKWCQHITTLFRVLLGSVWARNCTEAEWPALYRRIQRQKGQFVCCIDQGEYLVVSSVPIPGALELTPEQASGHLVAAVEAFPFCRKPISTSRGWKLRREDTPADCERLGLVPSSVSTAEIHAVFESFGLSSETKVPAGRENERRYVHADVPPALRADLPVEDIYFSLVAGERLDDVQIQVKQFQQRQQQPNPDTIAFSP